jgi:hypothetical protein
LRLLAGLNTTALGTGVMQLANTVLVIALGGR